jgi:hypothetical protein
MNAWYIYTSSLCCLHFIFNRRPTSASANLKIKRKLPLTDYRQWIKMRYIYSEGGMADELIYLTRTYVGRTAAQDLIQS